MLAASGITPNTDLTRNSLSLRLDFVALAEAYPALKPHIIQTPTGAAIDFKNDVSQRRLTEAILHRDFDLSVTLPPERLCPPVPNRLNYILWLGDLMHTVLLATLSDSSTRVVRGLDIGTGASAIYPLLGCRMHPEWDFTATDIDALSLEYAHLNVQSNALQERITIITSDPSGHIFAPLFQSQVKYDFTMCNPPFYSSRVEVIQSAEAKEFEPNAVCTGADVEMITPGGEGAFVGRMVQESLQLRDKCRWFTSMLGKMSTLTHIVSLLRENKVDNYAITELIQGKTRRWVIAWSFEDVRLPDDIGRLSHHGLQNIAPPRNTLRQPLAAAQSVERAVLVLTSVLASIHGLSVIKQEEQLGEVVVSATGNSWSRAARRKKRGGMQDDDLGTESVRFMCRIRCEIRTKEDNAHDREGVVLVFNWLAGNDRGLFESFASHVERKALTELQPNVVHQ